MAASGKKLCEAWGDVDFCDDYAATWEISVDEVHYGWLAPGESDLGLLRDVCLKGANVLDAGCGMAQNLVALAKRGATCFGIDLSHRMLEKASEVARNHAPRLPLELAFDDMRSLQAFPSVAFDLVLSVYSLEYVASLQEFRATIHRFYQRLNPGGVLILCFSHPSQLRRHHSLVNRSLPNGAGLAPTFNFSFHDTVSALAKTGFSIERIVEQETRNPSAISYPDSRRFPYHFKEGCNPCEAKYDDVSNESPHTIIYKARKPNIPTFGLSRPKDLGRSVRKIWGQRRTVLKRSPFMYLGQRYIADILAPSDNIEGVCDILNLTITPMHVTSPSPTTMLRLQSNAGAIGVSSRSVLGLVNDELARKNLAPIYDAYDLTDDDGITKRRPFLRCIVGLEDQLLKIFPGCEIDVLVFVNNAEPSSGELSLDEVTVHVGERVTVSLIAHRRRSARMSPQLTLI
jgi:SAM-dependent methyltransferase